MSNRSIEDIITGFSKCQINTMKRAQEISPLIKDRTLGPDLPENYWDNDETNILNSKQNEKENVKQTHISTKKLSKTPESKPCKKASIFLSPPSLQSKDYEHFKEVLLLRCEEEKRRKAIRKQLTEQQQKEHYNLQLQNVECENNRQVENKKWLQEKLRIEANILRQAEEIALEEQQQTDEELNALRKQTKLTVRRITFEAISQCQKQFNMKYTNAANMLLSLKQMNSPKCNDFNQKIKETLLAFEEIINKLAIDEYDVKELKSAQKICETVDIIANEIRKEMQNIVSVNLERSQAERRDHLEMQQQQANLKELQTQVALAVPINSQIKEDSTKTDDNNSMSRTIIVATPNENPKTSSNYEQIMAFYHEKVESVKTLKNDDNYKKYRSICQKTINTAINTISAVSPEHLQDKFNKIYGFLNGESANDVRITDHPLGRNYCLLFMAKTFVSQCEIGVSSNCQAAFPLASIIVSLWKLIPEFGFLFLAYLYKDSPFMAPYIPPCKEGQSSEEFCKQIGFKVVNGQIEPKDLYLKRQAGVARLYAAVMITSGRRADGVSHPHGIDNAWRWLANITLLPPLPDISATVIMEILQIIGETMWFTYSKQFIKLLAYIKCDYFPKLAAIDVGGPKTRFELQLSKFLDEGQIPKPQGTIQPGYW